MLDINNDISLLGLKDPSLKNVDASAKEDKALKKVSDDFESFFVQQLMNVSLKGTNVAGEGVGADIFKGMYTDVMSRQASGTFGISEMLYEFLSKQNKKDT